MSVIVVMNTDDASAGSTLAARNPSGTSVPAAAATNMLMIIAIPSTSPSIGLPRITHTTQRRHRAEHDAVAQADDGFLQQRLARIAPRQLAERDAAHDHRQRLRAGVAAHARHDRHEDRERPGTRSIVPSKSATTDGREERGHQVDAEPRQPLAQRLAAPA